MSTGQSLNEMIEYLAAREVECTEFRVNSYKIPIGPHMISECDYCDGTGRVPMFPELICDCQCHEEALRGYICMECIVAHDYPETVGFALMRRVNALGWHYRQESTFTRIIPKIGKYGQSTNPDPWHAFIEALYLAVKAMEAKE